MASDSDSVSDTVSGSDGVSESEGVSESDTYYSLGWDSDSVSESSAALI